MPRRLRIGWWFAIILIVIGIGPVAIAITGGQFSQTLGMMGYLGIVTLPLAIVGACLVPVLALWTLVDWLRR